MHGIRTWVVAITAVATGGLLWTASAATALDCTQVLDRRLASFEAEAGRGIHTCLRRVQRTGATCPDTRLERRLARLVDRTARTLARRCPDVDGSSAIAAIQSDLLCDLLGSCGNAGTITVRVANTAPAARAGARDATPPSRRLRVDAGFSGLAHDLQILEGAEYTADLTDCHAPEDTLCALHGATAGTAFGPPSPISVGGIPVCVAIGFASDLTGTFDLASGALTEAARVTIDISFGENSAPCPACIVPDGDPQLGEAGTCLYGAHDGSACVVEGLGTAGLGAARATSSACGAFPSITTFTTAATATTGAFDFAPVPNGPRCSATPFAGQPCPCGSCNDSALTPCHSDADCPLVNGAAGVCGSTRAYTALNGCVDDSATAPDGFVCADAGGGRGECADGPMDQHCAVATHRGCLGDDDCPAGDHCTVSARLCHMNPIAFVGTPDAPAGGEAHPTLVGAFCMASAQSAAVNAAAGFPGPVSYVWPTEITLGQ